MAGLRRPLEGVKVVELTTFILLQAHVVQDILQI